MAEEHKGGVWHVGEKLKTSKSGRLLDGRRRKREVKRAEKKREEEAAVKKTKGYGNKGGCP